MKFLIRLLMLIAFASPALADNGNGNPGGVVIPGGSLNAIQFQNPTGTFAGDSNLTWDNTNKFLGIGTSSPNYFLDVEKLYSTNPTQDQALGFFAFTTYGAKTNILDRRHALYAYAADDAAVNQVNVSAATNASPIVITTSTPNNYTTGERIIISGVGGNTAANGSWPIISTGASSFSLTGSHGNGAYTSGGIATNRSSFDGLNLYINPLVARNGLSVVGSDDDVNGIIITNSGTGKATDAIYIAGSGGVSGSAWSTIFAAQANANNGIQLSSGTLVNYGIDIGLETITSGIAMRIPNNTSYSSINTGSADTSLLKLDGSNVLNLYGGLVTVGASGVTSNVNLGIGAAPDVNLRVHTSTDNNLRFFDHVNLANGVYVQSANDAIGAFEGLEIAAGTLVLNKDMAGNVGIGSASPRSFVDMSQSTDSLLLPTGTTGNRPGSPVNGMLRYNTTATPAIEGYVNNVWTAISGSAGGVSSVSGDGSLYTNSASTGAVTLTLGNQTANFFLSGPTSGSAAAPTFRVQVMADQPKFVQATAVMFGMANMGGI